MRRSSVQNGTAANSSAHHTRPKQPFKALTVRPRCLPNHLSPADDAHRQLSLPTTAAHHRRRLAQQADASRQQQPHQEQQPHQQQQEEQQQQAAPPIEHQARAVALQCRFALEQHLVSLASSGLPLAQQAQQQAALDALSEEVEALATAVIAATQADVAGLHGELAQGGGLPKGADHADMAALLADGSFRDRLKDAHDDALLAVAAALEPHTQALAADVHAALAPLVLPPAALDPLPQYAGRWREGGGGRRGEVVQLRGSKHGACGRLLSALL